MPNPVINRRIQGTAPAVLPTRGLLVYYESTDFDTVANGTAVNIWNDKNGGGVPREFQQGSSGVSPVVDSTRQCNGHNTVRFSGNQSLAATGSLFIPATGIDGLDSVAIFKQDADPPAANGPVIGNWNQPIDFGNEQPFSDGNFYEATGQNARPSIGNPVTSTAGAFVCYNVTANSAGTIYSAWLNLENFFTSNSFTFQSRGNESFYTIGYSHRISNNTNFFLNGNIAAVYLWQTQLTNNERGQMRQYMKNLWGVPVA